MCGFSMWILEPEDSQFCVKTPRYEPDGLLFEPEEGRFRFKMPPECMIDGLPCDFKGRFTNCPKMWRELEKLKKGSVPDGEEDQNETSS